MPLKTFNISGSKHTSYLALDSNTKNPHRRRPVFFNANVEYWKTLAADFSHISVYVGICIHSSRIFFRDAAHFLVFCCKQEDLRKLYAKYCIIIRTYLRALQGCRYQKKAYNEVSRRRSHNPGLSVTAASAGCLSSVGSLRGGAPRL